MVELLEVVVSKRPVDMTLLKSPLATGQGYLPRKGTYVWYSLVADNRYLLFILTMCHKFVNNSTEWPHTSFRLKFTTGLEPYFAGLNDLMMQILLYFQAGYWRTDTIECLACLLYVFSASNGLLEGRNQESTPLQNRPAWTCLFNFNIKKIHSVISLSSWLMKLYKSPKVFFL